MDLRLHLKSLGRATFCRTASPAFLPSDQERNADDHAVAALLGALCMHSNGQRERASLSVGFLNASRRETFAQISDPAHPCPLGLQLSYRVRQPLQR